MTTRNPKQEGSNVYDCKPQKGLCPLNCNQCFYNRPGAFYVDPEEEHMPTVEEVGDGIMRVNSGHDSNFQKKLVVEKTSIYPERFFNTSIPNFDFPGPVVFTANREEEESCNVQEEIPDNLMFVRLRVSNTNLSLIDKAVKSWTNKGVQVVLTFMAYYTDEPIKNGVEFYLSHPECYVYKVRHINSYYCATDEFMEYVLKREKEIGGRLVSMCADIGSYYCRTCKNCETYYWQAKKRIREGKQYMCSRCWYSFDRPIPCDYGDDSIHDIQNGCPKCEEKFVREMV